MTESPSLLGLRSNILSSPLLPKYPLASPLSPIPNNISFHPIIQHQNIKATPKLALYCNLCTTLYHFHDAIIDITLSSFSSHHRGRSISSSPSPSTTQRPALQQVSFPFSLAQISTSLPFPHSLYIAKNKSFMSQPS
jgi:hypothetical protein